MGRFKAIAAEYAAVLGQEKSAADRLDGGAVAGLADAKCQAAARALRASREAFGRERFDRMLYETVRHTKSFSADTNFEIAIGRAVEREQRCQ